MGDRANILVKQHEGEPPVVVYSHWGGTHLENGAVENAVVDAQGRFGDPHYFTHLFIESLMKEGLVSGIGTSLDDNEHAIFVVDSEDGKIDRIDEATAREYLKSFTKEQE